MLRHFGQVCACLADAGAPLPVRAKLVLRSARVFLFYRAHSRLCSLDTWANYVAPTVAPDVFHHLSRRFYLARNLRARQRIEFLLTHYCFEEAAFSPAFRQQVYRNGGLLLWGALVHDTQFEIRLLLADRYAAEGDLSVCLMVGPERLHSISFSWANAEFATSKQTIVPFITANQGRRRRDEHLQEMFDAAFPQNARNFACYAAMQGIAQAIGAVEMLAVSSRLQVCYRPGDGKHFANAYDIFWNAVGGVELAACGFALPVPRPLKPLPEVPAKHRKRTALKRQLWAEITESSKAAMAAYFRVHQPCN